MTYTLKDYRRLFAQRTGGLVVFTPTNASTVTTAVNLTDPRLYSEIDQDTQFEDAFLFRPSAATANKLRYVKYVDSINGMVHPSAPWTVAPTSAEEVELHMIFDPVNEITALLNLALNRCLFATQVSFVVPNTTDSVFDVTSRTSLSWLIDDRWVYQAAVQTTGLDLKAYPPTELSGEVYQLDGHVYVDFGTTFATTQTIYLRVLKPYYQACYSAGAVLQVGLSLETDYCAANDLWVVRGAIEQAWEDYSVRLGPLAAQGTISNQTQAAAKFSNATFKNLRLPRRTLHRSRHFGPPPPRIT